MGTATKAMKQMFKPSSQSAGSQSALWENTCAQPPESLTRLETQGGKDEAESSASHLTNTPATPPVEGTQSAAAALVESSDAEAEKHSATISDKKLATHRMKVYYGWDAESFNAWYMPVETDPGHQKVWADRIEVCTIDELEPPFAVWVDPPME